MDGLVDRIRYRLRDAKHHQKQDSYGGLYDADNGVMLTGEISQDMLGGYNKTVLQYANKGPGAEHGLPRAAAGTICGTT